MKDDVRLRRRCRTALVHAVVTVTALAVAPIALSGTVSKEGGRITYDAGPGEDNNVLVTRTGLGAETQYHVSDTAGVNAGSGCIQVSGTEAVCGRADYIVVNAGDMDDEVANATAKESTLRGRDESDFIRGGFDDDQIEGGAGNDDLRPRAGLDAVFGGDGNDDLWTRSTSGPAAPDQANCGEGDADEVFRDNADDVDRATCELVDPALPPPAEEYNLTCDKRLTQVGDLSRDVLTGGRWGDRLFGHGGADTLRGRGANDCLAGGNGGDLLIGGYGADRARGQAGRDTLRGGPGADLLSGGGAADRIYAGGARDTVRAGDGNDVIVTRGDGKRDRVYCGRGRDRVFAGPTDVLSGCEVVSRS